MPCIQNLAHYLILFKSGESISICKEIKSYLWEKKETPFQATEGLIKKKKKNYEDAGWGWLKN